MSENSNAPPPEGYTPERWAELVARGKELARREGQLAWAWGDLSIEVYPVGLAYPGRSEPVIQRWAGEVGYPDSMRMLYTRRQTANKWPPHMRRTDVPWSVHLMFNALDEDVRAKVIRARPHWTRDIAQMFLDARRAELNPDPSADPFSWRKPPPDPEPDPDVDCSPEDNPDDEEHDPEDDLPPEDEEPEWDPEPEPEDDISDEEPEPDPDMESEHEQAAAALKRERERRRKLDERLAEMRRRRKERLKREQESRKKHPRWKAVDVVVQFSTAHSALKKLRTMLDDVVIEDQEDRSALEAGLSALRDELDACDIAITDLGVTIPDTVEDA